MWISWENFVHHCCSLTHAHLTRSLDYINLKQMPTHNFELNLSWWINILKFCEIHQGPELIIFTRAPIWNLQRTVMETATKIVTFETNMIFNYVTDVAENCIIKSFYWNFSFIIFPINKNLWVLVGQWGLQQLILGVCYFSSHNLYPFTQHRTFIVWKNDKIVRRVKNKIMTSLSGKTVNYSTFVTHKREKDVFLLKVLLFYNFFVFVADGAIYCWYYYLILLISFSQYH